MDLHKTIQERLNAGGTVAFCKGCGNICYQSGDNTVWLLHGSISDALESGELQSTIDMLPDINCGCQD